MKKLDYFKSFPDSQGNIYSLDMIRLNIDFGHDSPGALINGETYGKRENLKEFMNYMRYLNEIDARYEIKYYPNFSQFKYRHLWNVSSPIDDGVSLSIGLDLGGSNEARHKGFIEFNPNKCENSAILHEFIGKVLALSVHTDLVRFDLAIDIPIDRNLVRLVREGRKHYQYIDSGNGLTEYLGQRNTSGFVKLYDKTKESNLEEQTLTRLEMTIDSKTDIEKVFPVVRINDAQLKLPVDQDLTETDKVLVALLRKEANQQFYLSQLGWRKRKKLEPYLADRVLTLDKQLAYKVKTLADYYEHYYTSDFDKLQ